MSQAIDLPLTGLGLEMMFLGPTSVWHHRLCGPWGKLEASALFFKGNQGIDRPSSTKTTASPASLHFNVSVGAERSVNTLLLCQHSRGLRAAWLPPWHPSSLCNKRLDPDVM